MYHKKRIRTTMELFYEANVLLAKISVISIGMFLVFSWVVAGAAESKKERALRLITAGKFACHKEAMSPILEELAKAGNKTAYISGQRLKYPAFNSDLFYAFVASDSTDLYAVWMNYITINCTISINDVKVVEAARACEKTTFSCMSTSKTQQQFLTCKDTSDCKTAEKLQDAEVIDKKYCEKLYRRSL